MSQTAHPSPLVNPVSDLREVVLMTSYFAPLQPGRFTVENMALFLVSFEESEVSDALVALVSEGYALSTDRTSKSQPVYEATPEGWVARERLLRKFGRRHAALVRPLDYALTDLLLAILNSDLVAFQYAKGPYLPPSGVCALVECETYLPAYSSEDIVRAKERLLLDGLVEETAKEWRGRQYVGIRATSKGQRIYLSSTGSALGIDSGDWILRDWGANQSTAIRGKELIPAQVVDSSRYTEPAPVGAGHLGEVWRFHDSLLGRHVAIKFLHNGGGLSEAVKQGKILASFNHENIVRVYDCAVLPHPRTSKPHAALVLEFVAGKTLEELVKGKIPAHEAGRYATQLIDAACEFRSSGLIHGDLHAANIIISETGVLKVLDPWYSLIDLATRYSTMSRELRSYHEFVACRETVWSIFCQVELGVEDRSFHLKRIHAAATFDQLREVVAGLAVRSEQVPGPKEDPVAGLRKRLIRLLDEINPEIVLRGRSGAPHVDAMLSQRSVRRLESLSELDGFNSLMAYKPNGSVILASSNSRIGDALNDVTPSSYLEGYRLILHRRLLEPQGRTDD